MKTPDDITGPINLGNPEEYSMIALANKIKALTGSRSELVFKPLPGDDPKQRKPDIDLAKTHLRWQPRTNLDEGLKKTISYFDQLLLNG